MALDKTWGDVFWSHILSSKGMIDRADAAFRADQWLERQQKKDSKMKENVWPYDPEYSQGVTNNGCVILKNGQFISIDGVLEDIERLQTKLEIAHRALLQISKIDESDSEKYVLEADGIAFESLALLES